MNTPVETAANPAPSLPGKAPRYVRRLSPMERYSLVINEAYRYHVDGVVTGVGAVDPLLLQTAVNQAAEANPGIRVRLRGILRFCRWVDSGIAPQVRLLPLSDWDGDSEQGAAFLNERLQGARGGPVADVLIVPCRDGRTRLVFRSLHAAIDGRGFMHWLVEVFRALRGEPLQGSGSSLTDIEVQDQYAAQIPEEPAPAPLSCIPVLQPSPGEPGPLAFVWRRVTVRTTASQLLPKTAVFLAEWARRQQAGPVGFTIPIDYRGLRTQEMSIGNLTGYLRLSIAEDATPRGVMQQLTQRIRAFADCRQFPGIRKLLWMPLWLMLRQMRPKIDAALYTVNPGLPSGGIVSMGLLKTEHYCFPGFEAELVHGIPGAVGKFNLVFNNFPGFVTASFLVPAAYNRDGQLDQLVAAYKNHFSTAGSAP